MTVGLAAFVLVMIVGVVSLLVGFYLGMRFERYVAPTIRKELTRPWVPLSAVIHDVAREIERAQTIPEEQWLWIRPSGVPDVDYVKLAERAVNAGAHSAVHRRRTAALREMLGR